MTKLAFEQLIEGKQPTMESDKCDESAQRIEHKMLMAKLDTALLFFSSSLSFAFAVGNALVGLDWTRYFIPVVFLCWILPVYVGYIRGGLCKDSVHERFRGWIYLFIGGSAYAIYLCAWKFASILGYNIYAAPIIDPLSYFASSLLMGAIAVVLFITIFSVFIYPNLSVIWLLATEGKGRRIGWRMSSQFFSRSSSLGNTMFAAIAFGAAWFFVMLGLTNQQWLMSLSLGGLHVFAVYVPGWILILAALFSVPFLYACLFEYRARRNSQIWRLKGENCLVEESNYVDLNGQLVVAEEISDKLQNVKVSFPNWLVGVDLLVSRGEKRIGIQVNVSGYIDRKDLGREHIGCSFQQIGKERLDKSRGKVDFHVFLTRWPVHGKNEEHPFKYKFLIVPSSELEKRLTVKPALKGLYYLCFHFDENGKNVWDEGVWVPPTDPLTDYSQFLDAWGLLNKALQ